MLEILGKFYFIDIDAITNACKTGKKIKDDNDNETYEINIFKYEMLKVCVERVLNEFEQPVDDDLGSQYTTDLSTSFKFAFNTLIKNNIIIEDETFNFDE